MAESKQDNMHFRVTIDLKEKYYKACKFFGSTPSEHSREHMQDTIDKHIEAKKQKRKK